MIEPLGDERQYQTRIADRSYLVLEKQYALFPQQSGRLGIAPVMAEVRLPSGSSFDPFRTGGKIHRLRSQQLFVDVKPIPAEFAGPDWLPANKVELREQWQGDINSLVAGEPVTRSLILSADGLTSAQLPELKLGQVDGIKQYPDQPVLENSRGSNGINGKREQKVALIPGAEGRYLLPEIRLPWWNLQTGKLETATIPAREIIVNAAANAIVAAPSGESGQPSEVTPQVLETRNYWIWISLLLAAGWSMSLLYWRLNSKPSPKRNTLPVEAQGVREARKQLQQACDANDGVAARPALLNWGRALLAPREVDNLHQLGRLMGADLAREIEVLNQSLYAEARAQWQGRGLWSLCQQLEQSTRSGRNQVGPELSPLNP